jgi:23S rRNA pseudouridine1911/1915/1917 synthase
MEAMLPPFSLVATPFLVHEDQRLLIAWKPAGLHTVPGEGGDSLVDWVFSRSPEAAGAAVSAEMDPGRALARNPAEGGLVHRLDRLTSGLVLFAKDPACLAFLLAEQAAGRIEKEYRLAASPSEAGLPGSRPERGRAEGSIVSSRFRPFGPRGARVACVDPGTEPGRGRTSRAAASGTVYVSEILGEDGAAAAAGSALDPRARGYRVRIRKGFRHQIRAHFAWLGMPLLGDGLYGGQEAPRLFLEAVVLSFREPDGGVRRVDLDDVAFGA